MPTSTASPPIANPPSRCALIDRCQYRPFRLVGLGAVAGDRIRTFVALAVPEVQRATLADHLSRCASAAPGYRWVAAENLHLTLRFIGWVGPDELARVRRELERLLADPFEVAI